MKGYKSYKSIQTSLKMASSQENYNTIYEQTRSIKSDPFLHKDVINTLEHLWGYFKGKAHPGDKRQFFILLNRCRQQPVISYRYFPEDVRYTLAFISYLLETYPDPYLLQSTLFLPQNEWHTLPDSPPSKIRS
jgi:uncharacterized protein YbgA (DUF1722 family)